MSVDIRSSDRRRYQNELQAREKEIAAGLLKTSQPSSPVAVQENEKRMRREIANSNERRRMQCINAGFSSLRALIPQLEGDKLSKAAILQQATDYISSLEQEKIRLELQLDHTKGLLSGLGQGRLVTDAYVSSSPPPSKRKKRDTESSDEGVCSLSDASEDSGSELQQENLALRHQLELERQRYAALEQHNRLLETQFLTLLHSQASHVSEMRTPSLDHRHFHQPESVYDMEIVDQVASRQVHASQYDSFHPPRLSSPRAEQVAASDTFDATTHRPLSPRAEQVAASDTFDATTHRPLVIDSSSYRTQESVSPMPTVEAISKMETLLPAATTLPSQMPVTDADQHSNYHHRDHPRRRHRQQAQLERQREGEEFRRQQDNMAVSDTVVHHRKHNTQNLEKLVEAIRQIEGDRLLCKFNEDEQHDKHATGRNTDSSDQDEPKSESSGRDSPLHHHHHQKDITFSSNNMSKKYPIASTLLHRPVSSSYQPGVIVHKL